MRTSSQSIAAILACLDTDTAAEARSALDWLMPDGGTLDDLLELDVLTFLTYSLPTKWLTDTRHHHEVAWSLADFFTAAGKTRYAAHCRAPATHLLLDTWDTDPQAARRQMRRMLMDSGVHPMDTSLLVWGDIQGMTEYATSVAVSRALEQAVDAGQVVPGARGWRAAAAAVTDRVLNEPSPTASGSRLDQIHQERRTTWIEEVRRRGLPLPDQVVDQLTTPLTELIAAITPSLEPVHWLLDQIGEGVRLTQAGYLPTALVKAFDQRYGQRVVAWPHPAQRESDQHDLAALRELLERRRLLTKARGRLTVSAAGRRARANDALLVEAVTEAIFDITTWYGDAALALAVIHLAHGPGSPAHRDVHEQLVAYLSARWARGSRTHSTALTVDDVRFAHLGFSRLAGVFDWQEPSIDYETYPALTHAGHAVCLFAVIRAAHGPRG